MKTPRYTLELAERLIASGQLHSSIDLTRAAALDGQPEALFALGLWQLTGQILPRDLLAARRALGAAAAAGHGQARRLFINLCANGSGQPCDWSLALRQLELGANDCPDMGAELALLGRMAIDDAGFPTSPASGDVIYQSPRIAVIRAFLSEAECRHLVRTSLDLLRPSMIAHPVNGALVAHPVRRSASAVIGPMREDLVIGAINRRIASATGTDLVQGEPLNLLRYRAGDEYKWHLDALPGVLNQRQRTVLLYLDDGYAGGETAFQALDMTFAGGIGDALMFDNLLPNGTPDVRTRHAGLPVRSGTKHIAARWLRQRPIDIWRPDTLG